MSTPQSWSRGSRRQADEVRLSQKVMEMGRGTDKGGKRQERKKGRSYHDTSKNLSHCKYPTESHPMQGTLESKDAPRKKQESVPLLPPAVPPHPYMFCLSL